MKIWKDIPGYEGLYQVSNDGSVKSFHPNNKHEKPADGLLMKQYINPYKYFAISLFKNKKRCSVRVHRLVALAFIPNPKSLPQINHLDCDTLNNHVDNLEWCDASTNAIHAYANGLRKSKPGVLLGPRKIFIQKDMSGNTIREFNGTRELESELGVKNCNGISAAANGKSKTSHGYQWAIKEIKS